MAKKLLLLLLCVLMCTSSLAACKKSGDDGKTPDATTEEQQSGSDVNEDPYVSPDMGDREPYADFCVYTWKTDIDDWVLEYDEDKIKEQNIDADTYRHLAAVEEELKITFKVVATEFCNYENMGNFLNKLQTYQMSGSTGVDLVCQYSPTASVGASMGLYKNLMEVENLNWDAPYWSQDFLEANSINGKMFYCTGDMSGSVLRNMVTLVYNFDAANKYGFEDLYQTVRDGEWTLEKLQELTKDIYTDNPEKPDGIANVGDSFGLVISAYVYLDVFQHGCDLKSIIVNEMGELEINEQLYKEYGTDVCSKLRDLMHRSDGTYCNTKTNRGYEEAMLQGKAVFQTYTAERIMTELSKSEINYGILPIPKYDTAQKDYHTCLFMPYNMFSLMVEDSENSEAAKEKYNVAGAVMEAMAHNGHKNLTPAIYEKLKYRYSPRSDDGEMLEILRKGIVYDPGRFLATVEGFYLMRAAVRDDREISVLYKEKERTLTEHLADVNFSYS